MSIIGDFKSLKTLNRIVIDTMCNIHPIYNIKELMIKRELAKDELLKNENWERFLPKFRKVNAQKREKKKRERAQKREYTPFPPAPQPRQEDLLMETGEYFLKDSEKKQARLEEKISRQQEKRKRKDELK